MAPTYASAWSASCATPVRGGVYACFKCCVPVVAQRHAQREASNAQSTAAAAATQAPRSAAHGQPSSDSTPATSRPQRERRGGVNRFEPHDRQVDVIQARIAHTRQTKASRTAVTAELRAIGLDLPQSQLTLQRAPLRRSHQFGAAGRGASVLIGRVFDEGNRTFIVEDVGPSALQAGAPTVAFVVDVAHRVRATGRLDEQCEEREVQAEGSACCTSRKTQQRKRR